MKDTYWATIAQLAATFSGLVFVAFSIYLDNLRKAIDEIKLRLPEAKEVLGTSLYIVVLSNLLFYLLPLLLSLVILIEQPYPSQVYTARAIFIAILTILLVFFSTLNKHRSIRQEWQSVQNASNHNYHFQAQYGDIYRSERKEQMRLAKSGRRFLHLRMRASRALMLSNFIVLLVLYILLLKTGSHEWLQIWAITNLGLGVAFSFIDLALFRPENVFFERIDRQIEEFQSQGDEMRNLMTALSPQYSILQQQSYLASDISSDLSQRFNVLSNQLPPAGIPIPLVQEFIELGPIVTLTEIKGYGHALSQLRGGVIEFERRLKKAFEATQSI